MNRRTPGRTLTRAIPGFLLYKSAQALSPNTLRSYHDHLKLWLQYIGEVPVERITSSDLRAFLAWLRHEYQPHRLSGNTAPLAPKTLRNYWISLSAFFTWAAGEFGIANPMRGVPAPKFQDVPVQPFTRGEIEALLKAAEFCHEADTTRRRRFVMRRPTARRDRALILVLLDTGLRASELCALTVGDVDLKSGQVRVKHGDAGGAKGGKGRVVFLGQTARRSLWRYLARREDGEDPNAALFLGKLLRRMNKGVLRQLIARLGVKAGVAHAHPHRFETTEFLAARAPRLQVLFTPPDVSRLNQAEALLEAFSERYLLRGSWCSRVQMVEHIDASTQDYNRHFAHPFAWQWSCRAFKYWLNNTPGQIRCRI